MPRVTRLSDVIEVHAERAIYYATGGLAFSVLAGLLLYYRGQSGMFVPLGSILLLIGLPLMAFAGYLWRSTRDLEGLPIKCPFCEAINEVLGDPDEDFACVSCHRMIPILEGKVLDVSQVRCGFCNELNYYSSKTEALLCEQCNHEIPLALDENAKKKIIPSIYAVVDDEAYYELMLIGQGHKEEELITALQHMLALNRNQVKQMLTELPVTLLTGITRRKAEMLKAQLSLYEGEVEFRQMEEARY